jgi:hypothetical protein
VLEVRRENRVGLVVGDLKEGGKLLMLGCRRHGVVLDMSVPKMFSKATRSGYYPWAANCMKCAKEVRAAAAAAAVANS